ncbi:MAG: hypothetical protein E7311_01590 [Clostridiales bacterium]|nr:hypothetical protein [Clostridiales bacterium]
MFTIYTQENCPNCLELKNFMKERNIQYTERNINEDFEAKAKLIMNDIEVTPALSIENNLFGGNLDYLTRKVLEVNG